MNYFDGLTNAVFKKDEDGRSVFYLWGIFGKGVILTSTEQEESLKQLLIRYYIIGFLLMLSFLLIIMGFRTDFRELILILPGSVFALTLWLYLSAKKITKGLETSSMRLSVFDAWQNSAARFSLTFIWTAFIFMSLFAVGTLLIAYYVAEVRILSLILTVVSIFTIYAYYNMLQYKYAHPDAAVPAEVEPSAHSQSIEWNRKNILLLFMAAAFALSVSLYSYFDSNAAYEQRMAMYNKMSTEEMARYLALQNDEPEDIDPVTYHKGAASDGNNIILYKAFHIPDLLKWLANRDALLMKKDELFRKTAREMCKSPTYKLFYDKGGSTEFSYTDRKTAEFLFSFTIDRSSCTI